MGDFRALFAKIFYICRYGFIVMKNFFAEKYVSPEVVKYEILSEGVLCGSNEGLGEEPGNPWDQSLYGHDLY